MPVFTTPFGVLLTLQLAAAPPVPPPPPAPGPQPAAPADTGAAPADTGGSSDLAAEAPQPGWIPEGGAAAHKSSEDPQEINRKVRNAARTTIAGGSIAIVGAAAGIAGPVMWYLARRQLSKVRDGNEGSYLPDDPKRQRNIALARVSPIIAYVGAGLFVSGTLMAIVAGRRFKKLREDKRTSVAVGPMPLFKGGGLSAEVRF